MPPLPGFKKGQRLCLEFGERHNVAPGGGTPEPGAGTDLLPPPDSLPGRCALRYRVTQESLLRHLDAMLRQQGDQPIPHDAGVCLDAGKFQMRDGLLS